MEGWDDIGSLIAVRPGIEPTTALDRKSDASNRYATKPTYVSFPVVNVIQRTCNTGVLGLQVRGEVTMTDVDAM